MHSAALRSSLIELDLVRLRRLWAHVSPHLPQPQSDREALISAHMARTQASSVPLRFRAWSHRWLLDNGYPSGLPDWLKPKAERMYPKIADAVGIAVSVPSSRLELGQAIRGAMEDVVENHYADGVRDPVVIKPRMMEARERVKKRD